jgi:uncharacterized protein DUF2630/histidine kinase-like protein
LLLSELVSNSVAHSGLGASDDVRIDVRRSPTGVRVEVEDDGAGFGVSAVDADRPHLGFRLIESVADRWGVRTHPTRVWNHRAHVQTSAIGAEWLTATTQGGTTMEDSEVLARIGDLADEEHRIFEREGRGEATDEDHERLKRIAVTLDQCWDLLHQRRARRAAGMDPDEASARDERTVEGYLG